MKEREDPKKESLLKEREDLLRQVEILDSILEEGKPIDAKTLKEQIFAKDSFAVSINWLQPFIQRGLSDMRARLDKLVAALEMEFPKPTSVEKLVAMLAEKSPSNDFEKFTSQDGDKLLERARAHSIIKLFIDSSLILYALGRNGAAIVDLHGTLERQAVERILELVVLPERIEAARRALERLTLQDLASMLVECGILVKDDLVFTDKLSKLRNGLAHRNPRMISNAVLSGQQIQQAEIEAVVSDVDYLPYAIGAIRFLIKTMKWYETA